MRLIKTNDQTEESINHQIEDILKELIGLSVSEESKKQKLTLASSLKSLNFSYVNSFLKNLTNILRERQFSFDEWLASYKSMSLVLREAQVIPPFIDALYHGYCTKWQKGDARLLEIWRHVPSHLFQQFLSHFQLQEAFKAFDCSLFLKSIRKQLFEGRIAQVCEQIRLYLPKENEENQSEDIEQFLQTQLILRLISSEQIFSQSVINLLKFNKRIALKVLRKVEPSQGVKIANKVGMRLEQVPHLNDYVLRKHYRSIVHEQKWWYMIEDKISFDQTFVSFLLQDLQQNKLHTNEESSIFVQPSLNRLALINSISKRNDIQRKNIENNNIQKDKIEERKNIPMDNLGYIIENIKDERQQRSIENAKQVREFVLLKGEHGQLQGKHKLLEEYVENPLDERDMFGPASLIIERYQGVEEQEYIELQRLGMRREDVVWVDCLGPAFQCMKDEVLRAKEVGFDTEFRCASKKEEQQGVAVIQLATSAHCFIIDFLKMESLPPFQGFLRRLLECERPVKIGHTLGSDLRFLGYTTETVIAPQGLVDLVVEYKKVCTGDRLSALAHIAQRCLGRKMCKYEQRSNWNRRPLRLRQLHYAALDAFVCLKIYSMLRTGSLTLQPHTPLPPLQKTKHLKAVVQNGTVIGEREVLSTETETLMGQREEGGKEAEGNHRFFVEKKEPDMLEAFVEKMEGKHRFLVDNMLKKLCSQLRNAGIDAEFVPDRDFDQIVTQALKQQRIIITRDSKFYARKRNLAPTYFLSQKNDTDKMFSEVIAKFQVQLDNYEILSRCVKCNGDDFVVIPSQEALKQLQFKYHQSQIQEFWRCTRCRQLYWQGAQFKKAIKKYSSLAETLANDA